MVGWVGYTRVVILLVGWLVVAYSMGVGMYWPLVV